MKDFHRFLKNLLIVWMFVYAVLVLPELSRCVTLYVLSGFTMPGRHYFEILHAVYQGLLWMMPTVFLATAYYFSRPVRRPRSWL